MLPKIIKPSVTRNQTMCSFTYCLKYLCIGKSSLIFTVSLIFSESWLPVWVLAVEIRKLPVQENGLFGLLLVKRLVCVLRKVDLKLFSHLYFGCVFELYV